MFTDRELDLIEKKFFDELENLYIPGFDNGINGEIDYPELHPDNFDADPLEVILLQEVVKKIRKGKR